MDSAIQPVVLVGGASARFGRDKLREPVGGGGGRWLVDLPIAALRSVFGPMVVAVGDCAPEVAARADAWAPDAYPDAGPAGGVLTALERFGADVLVLAGDLPRITPEAVRALADAWSGRGGGVRALACARGGGEPEPCVGVYSLGLIDALRARLAQGRRSLHNLVPAQQTIVVPVDPETLMNANDPEALRRALEGGG